MKKTSKLFALLFSVAFFTATAFAGATNTPAWSTYGNPSVMSDAYNGDLIFNGGNTPYFYNGTSQVYTLSDNKWTSTNLSFTPPLHSSIEGTIAIDTQNPEAMPYIDLQPHAALTLYEPTLMQYVNNTWKPLTIAGLPSAIGASSIAVSRHGTLYLVVVRLVSATEFKLQVLKSTGSFWVQVGGDLLETNSLAYNVALQFDANNTPFVTYAGVVYKLVGNQWQAIALPPTPNLGFSASTISPAGVPYFISTTQSTAPTVPAVITVSQYDFLRAQWVNVGQVSLPVVPNEMLASAYTPNIVVSSAGIPTVFFDALFFNTATSALTYQPTVLSFSGSSGATGQWVSVGNIANAIGNSRLGVVNGFSVDAQNNLYFSYANGSQASILTYQN